MVNETIIEVNGLQNCLGGNWVHKDVNFSVSRGEIVAIIGGSGAGKTTILRSLLLLQPPTAGELKMFGVDIWQTKPDELMALRRKIGVLFQKSALFSGMSILENVMFPLERFTQLDKKFIRDLAFLKLLMVGLEAKDMHKMPSELSGGMQKRVAAARAIALEPDLVFLDEPVSGLDPKSAKAFDELLLYLREQLGFTIVMVSHDVRSLERVTDQIIFLGDGVVLCHDILANVKQSTHPLVQNYFASA